MSARERARRGQRGRYKTRARFAGDAELRALVVRFRDPDLDAHRSLVHRLLAGELLSGDRHPHSSRRLHRAALFAYWISIGIDREDISGLWERATRDWLTRPLLMPYGSDERWRAGVALSPETRRRVWRLAPRCDHPWISVRDDPRLIPAWLEWQSGPDGPHVERLNADNIKRARAALPPSLRTRRARLAKM